MIKELPGYIFRQCLTPFLLFTGVLTVVIWLTQSLRIIDIVLNKGQSAMIFLEMAILTLPLSLGIVLPVALLAAVLYTLHRLLIESELVIMWSAGSSFLRVAAPILILAGVVTVILYAITLYFMPSSARATRDKLFEIKTDIAAGLIQEGVFSTPVDGLTVFIRKVSTEGDLLGVLVHENREEETPVTYLAERGSLQQTDQGPRLLLVNGNIQRVNVETGQINILYFDEYGFLLAPFTTKGPERFIKPRERFLGDLLSPEDTAENREHWSRLIARGHEQLTSPLYALAFTAIALAGLLPGRYRRRRLGGQIFAIVVLCIAIRLSGMAAQNAAVRDLSLIPLTYVIPLGSFVLALLILFQDRIRKPVPENAEAR